MSNDEFDPMDILRRMFEPLPPDWQHTFHIGSRVRLTRPILAGVPVGAEGEILDIHAPESGMYEKGHLLSVQFDLRPFALPLDPDLTIMLRVAGIPEAETPQFHQSIVTDVGPNDIALL
ncbi:MAG: hypothetical protein K8L97_22205 [Anaerolineae bacterium]|nr:hypothetical protein [Anaerolineae bacterium]